MHGNTEEFKQKYRDLPDDGLLAINRDELIESARQCYDEELARRSLTPPQPEPAEGSEPTDELVSAGTFMLKRDSDLARGILESVGIPCFEPDEHMSDIAPYLIATCGLGLLLGSRFSCRTGTRTARAHGRRRQQSHCRRLV